MQAFSWEMAESLAEAHMRRLGFGDARTTNRGADEGLDVVSSRAAAQVKAHQKPIGSPDVQKLKGSAFNFEISIFYSMSGYTDQAKEYAEMASVALFEFDSRNNVEPVNSYALALLPIVDLYSARAAAPEIGREAIELFTQVKEFINYVVEWMAVTPYHLNIPTWIGTRIEVSLMSLSFANLTRPSTDDISNFVNWVQGLLEDLRGVVGSTGEILGFDFTNIGPSQAKSALERARNGDISEMKMPSHLIPLLERHKSYEEGWRYLTEISEVVIEMQKFVKVLNQTNHAMEEATGKDWSKKGSSTTALWEKSVQAAGNFTNWANRAFEEEILKPSEGWSLFDEFRDNVGELISKFGYDQESLYAISREKTATWLHVDENEEDSN